MLQKPKKDLRDPYTLGLHVWAYIIDQKREEQAGTNVVRFKAPGTTMSEEMATLAKQTSPEEFARYAVEYLDSVRGTPGWILPSDQQIEALKELKAPHKHN